jgi:hypothetical protein
MGWTGREWSQEVRWSVGSLRSRRDERAVRLATNSPGPTLDGRLPSC